MFRAGLVEVLNSKNNIEVLFDAASGKELIKMVRGQQPDIVFLDYKMPEMSGMQVARILTQKYKKIKILMLSGYDDEEFVVSSIASGAVGYITKEENSEEIFRAIESVQKTGYYINDRTSKHLVRNLVVEKKIRPKFKDDKVVLTENEKQVIRLMSKEYSSREIAELMHKAHRTIEGYRTSIIEKTGARNACGIVMYGVKNGIIEM